MPWAKVLVGAVGAVLIVVALLGVVGTIPGLAVVCTTNCTAGIDPDFSVQENGYVANVTDESTWTTTASGEITDVVVAWGDGLPSTTYAADTEHLPIGHSFIHTYLAAGTYTITETLEHEQCVGGKGGISCGTTDVVAQGAFAFSGAGGNSFSAHFTYKVSDEEVTLTDNTVTTGNPTLTKITLTWGDGTVAYPTALGFTLTHDYATTATETITEVVAYSYDNEPTSSTYSASVPVGCASCSNQVTITPSFSTVFSGYVLNLTDTSTTTGGPTFAGATVAWGDGSVATVAAATGLGFHLTHTYFGPGNYTINETVSWTANGGTFSASASNLVSLPCSGSCTQESAPPTSHGFNLTTGLLLSVGASLLLVLAPIRRDIDAVLIAAVLVGVTVLGYVVGGPGPL